MVKNPPAKQETQVYSLVGEDALEKKMATHSSGLSWEIPCAEEPGRPQSMGSQRVGHNQSDLSAGAAAAWSHDFKKLESRKDNKKQ